MRFQAAHKLVTYLLVLVALAALATTRALATGSAIIFLIVCAASYGVDAGNRKAAWLDRAAGPMRAGMGALLVVIVWRIWRRMPDSDLAPAFDLVLALLGYKLCYRRSHRDYVHIYALAFLLVLVASTITATVVFMAIFAVYVVLATWALILFHLRREMEENYLVRHSAQAPSQKVGIGRILGSRRVVGRAFFGATFAVAAAVFVGAVAIFTFVPRLGAGFVLGARAPGNVIGLSDEVALGRYGVLGAARHTVLFRATLPRLGALADDEARRAAAEQLYFRGAVYDSYDRGRWIRSRRPELRTVIDGEADRYFIHEVGDGGSPNTLAGTERTEIEAVGIPAAVLFAIDRPIAIELPATHLGAAGSVRVAPRWSGEAALRVGGESSDGFVTLTSAHYVGFSRIGPAGQSPAVPDAIDMGTLRGSPQLDPKAREDYLAVPGGMGRLERLASSLGTARDEAGEMGDVDKIGAVTGWLRAGHTYTLRPPARPAAVDPVEDFLFDQPLGHCEFFASAAVLMLRVAGVPARYVTGFRGGEWNPIGGYVAVRDERAHAWAEAFVRGDGWVRVDATPPAAGVTRAGRFAETSDALDFFWSRWVVGYDLGRQRDLAHRAWRHVGQLAPVVGWRRVLAAFGLATAMVALALGLRRGRRRHAHPAPVSAMAAGASWRARAADGAIDRLYRRALGRLAGVGWPRRPSETPHEYAERLRRAGLYASGPFEALTERYAAARFGGHLQPDDAVAELGRTVLAALSVGDAGGEKTGRSP
jgi:transglutaminase-like putative cysteine protease